MIKNNAAPPATTALMPSDSEFHQTENATKNDMILDYFYARDFKIILSCINENFLSSKVLICTRMCSRDVNVVPSS